MFDIGVVPTIHIADITYIGTAERRLYLGCARDVFTCELVGYAMGRRMTQDVAPQARRCVERNTRQTPGLVHNSIRALSTFRRRRSLRKLAKQRWLPASGSWLLDARATAIDSIPQLAVIEDRSQ